MSRIHLKAIFGKVQVIGVVAADPLEDGPGRARMPTKLRQRSVVVTIGRRRALNARAAGDRPDQPCLTEFGAKRRHPPVRTERPC